MFILRISEFPTIPSIAHKKEAWRIQSYLNATITIEHVFRIGRNGVTAARAAVSKHLEQQGRSEADENPTHDTTDPVGATATDTKAQRAKRERTKRVLEEDAESWMESLGVPEDYVDYGAVAQERVSAARRTRGSDLARGPACPVCSG